MPDERAQKLKALEQTALKRDTLGVPDPPAAALSAPNSASSHESAAEIARRVASELQQLSTVTARIECAVSGLILNSPGSTAGLHRDLQSLDSLGQMLDALAQFLNDMATQIPPNWQFDPTKAASAIKLKDLAQRLVNQKNEAATTRANDCDFF